MHKVPGPLAVIGVLALVVSLAGCGAGGDESPPSSGNFGPFISISLPTTDPTSSQVCNNELLAGSAGFGTSWRCCTGTADQITGVNVTWRNETTGSSGEARQNVFCPIISFCEHRWDAAIPLVLGDNRITVTASDTTTGAATTTAITINKPILTYTVSGTFLSHLGTPPGIGNVLVKTAGAGLHSAGVAADGTFQMSCVPDGSYTLTPSSTIAYDFSPPDRALTVAGADVTGQSFSATAFLISGNMTFTSNGAGKSSQAINLSGSGSTATNSTDSAGSYNFLAPNGSYTLTPVDFSGRPEPSNPPRRNVLVDNADLPGQDFLF